MKTFDVASRLIPSFGSPSRIDSTTKSESRLTLMWNGVWQRLVEGLVGSSELQISHKTDRQGNTQWLGYDPLTGHAFSGSEAEMRCWIEDRYYN
jgi:hypothetical protein